VRSVFSIWDLFLRTSRALRSAASGDASISPTAASSAAFSPAYAVPALSKYSPARAQFALRVWIVPSPKSDSVSTGSYLRAQAPDVGVGRKPPLRLLDVPQGVGVPLELVEVHREPVVAFSDEPVPQAKDFVQDLHGFFISSEVAQANGLSEKGVPVSGRNGEGQVEELDPLLELLGREINPREEDPRLGRLGNGLKGLEEMSLGLEHLPLPEGRFAQVIEGLGEAGFVRQDLLEDVLLRFPADRDLVFQEDGIRKPPSEIGRIPPLF
jgi:hypothetical protein